MLPPPPRSTLFPYTTLFRSNQPPVLLHELLVRPCEPRQLLLFLTIRANDANPSEAFLRDGAQVRQLRSEEHTSELQSQSNLVCRLLLEKKKKKKKKREERKK